MTANSIEIRRHKSGEQKAILSLINEIMSKEYGDDLAAYPTGDIENLEVSYGNLGEAFFVAIEGKKIVGTVGIKKEDDRVALLRRLFVSSEYRGRKIGKQLVEYALRFCREVGYSELIFKTTSRMVGAIDLCQKCGFVQRAKIQLGPIELRKYSLPIRNGAKSASAS